jgi:hypothetical protein
VLLTKIQPGVDFSKTLGPPIPRDSWNDDQRQTSKPRLSPLRRSKSMPHIHVDTVSPSSSPPPPFIPNSPTDASADLFSRPEAPAHSTHLILDDPPTLRPDSAYGGPELHNTPGSDQSSESDELLTPTEGPESDAGRPELLLPWIGDMNRWKHKDVNQERFHGSSSGTVLYSMAKQVKEHAVLGKSNRVFPPVKSFTPNFETSLKRPQFWKTPRARLLFHVY